MKRFPAFLLAALFAVSIILPVSALDLQEEIDSSFPLIEVYHNSDISTFSSLPNMEYLSLSDIKYVAFSQSNDYSYSFPFDSSFISAGTYPNGIGVRSLISSTTINARGYYGICIPARPGDDISVSGISFVYNNGNTAAQYSGSLYTWQPTGVSATQLNVFSSFSSSPTGIHRNVNGVDAYAHFIESIPYDYYTSPPSSSPSWTGFTQFSYHVPDSFQGEYIIFAGIVTTNNTSIYYGLSFNSPALVDVPYWVRYLPKFALESTQQSLLSVTRSIDTTFNSVAQGTSLKDILDAINASGGNSPVDSLVSGWSDKFDGQISQVEDGLSPSNPALPNGGDIGAFAGQISDGLGLQGSSFSGSDFNAATSSFTGSDSIGVGGPWEFFTQGVADDLSGDSPMGIDDDYDPILAWMEQAERRRKSWSNPS